METAEPEYIDLQDKNGCTALHLAAIKGNGDIVKLLLEYGANTDIQNEDGNTALHLAAKEGYDGCATNLLHFGARTDIVNKNDETAYNLACANNHKDVMLMIDFFEVYRNEIEKEEREKEDIADQ